MRKLRAKGLREIDKGCNRKGRNGKKCHRNKISTYNKVIKR